MDDASSLLAMGLAACAVSWVVCTWVKHWWYKGVAIPTKRP